MGMPPHGFNPAFGVPPMGLRPPMGMPPMMGMPQYGGIHPMAIRPSAPMAPVTSTLLAPPKMVTAKSLMMWVGNIARGVTNDELKLLLQPCGTVVSFNRPENPDTKTPKNFLFCSFATPEETVVALRLLHDLPLGGGAKIQVKIEEKINTYLDEYMAAKAKGGETIENKDGEIKEKISAQAAKMGLEAAAEDAKEAISKSVRESAPRDKEGRDRDRSPPTRRSPSPKLTEAEQEAKRAEKARINREKSYRDRLAQWENRERERERGYVRDEEREQTRKETAERAAKKTSEFERTYDDVHDDDKYYRGSSMVTLKKDREREIKWDDADRIKEQTELSEPANAALSLADTTSTGLVLIPCASGALASSSSVSVPTGNVPISSSTANVTVINQSTSSSMKEGSSVSVSHSSSHSSSLGGSHSSHSSSGGGSVATTARPSTPPPATKPVKVPAPTVTAPLATKIAVIPARAPKRVISSTAFSAENEEQEEETVNKRKLIKLEYTDDQIRAAGVDPEEERRKKVNKIIEGIPKDKEELFAYNIEWSMLDESVLQKVENWVSKKIIDYIGCAEPSLVEFICNKIKARSPPRPILDDIAMILDDEAETFVLKLWRLLIFETQSRLAKQ